LQLKKVDVGHEFAGRRLRLRLSLRSRRGAAIGQGADRSFPQTTVALDALDETNDLHASAAVRALEWIDLEEAREQHEPGGEESRAGIVPLGRRGGGE